MGKSILIITLGVSLIIGFIILKINTNSTSGVESTMNKFDKTHARLIANSAVEIYLEKLFTDESLVGQTFSGNLMNGSYSLSIIGPYNNAKLTSTANFLGVNHTSIVEVELVPPPTPAATAAIYFTTSALSGVKNLGDKALFIDGNNYYMNATPSPNGKDLIRNTTETGVPGITVDNQADKDYLVSSFGDFLDDNVKGFVDGKSTSSDTAVTVTGVSYDWQPLADYLISAAKIENTFNADDNIPSELGTLANPQITFINEPTDEVVQFAGNTTGAGILIINGNVKFTSLVFNGLVFCYRETDLEFELKGNSIIIGAMIVAGNTIAFKGNGDVGVYYSSEALQNTYDNIDDVGFKVTSWWE